MSKHEKTLDRMCAKPTPSNIKWDDLESLLVHLGYRLIKGKGSRRKFYHAGKDALISCHEPHPSPDVDKGAVDAVVEHLKAYGFL